MEIVSKEAGTPSASVSQRCLGVTTLQEPVHQRAFFLLYHERLPSCGHHELQMFSGFTLKCKLLNAIKITAFEEDRVAAYRFTGPSIASTDRHTSADMVVCISFPPLPSAEFAARARPESHPNVHTHLPPVPHTSASCTSRLCRKQY